jgi:hypothetical protein
LVFVLTIVFYPPNREQLAFCAAFKYSFKTGIRFGMRSTKRNPMIRIIIGLFVVAMVFVMASLVFSPRNPTCVLRGGGLTISTVSRGEFLEWIPISGSVITDSSHQKPSTIKVLIDELYLPRVHTDLRAITTFNYADYVFRVTEVLPTVVNGRFYVVMNYTNTSAVAIPNQNNLRFRLQLSDPSEETLLPVGGFYKDTGGSWVYVVNEDGTATKRVIKLGRKNPDHFQVLAGLAPGERVITSSYENFKDKVELHAADLKSDD